MPVRTKINRNCKISDEKALQLLGCLDSTDVKNGNQPKNSLKGIKSHSVKNGRSETKKNMSPIQDPYYFECSDESLNTINGKAYLKSTTTPKPYLNELKTINIKAKPRLKAKSCLNGKHHPKFFDPILRKKSHLNFYNSSTPIQLSNFKSIKEKSLVLSPYNDNHDKKFFLKSPKTQSSNIKLKAKIHKDEIFYNVSPLNKLDTSKISNKACEDTSINRSLRPKRLGLSYTDNLSLTSDESAQTQETKIISTNFKPCLTINSKSLENFTSTSKILGLNDKLSLKLGLITKENLEDICLNIKDAVINLEKCDSPAFLEQNSLNGLGLGVKLESMGKSFVTSKNKSILKSKKPEENSNCLEKLKRLRSSTVKNSVKYCENKKVDKKIFKTPNDKFEWAIKSLHASTTPKTLPCREIEMETIASFLSNCLTNNLGGCMYISGVPGTGKTAAIYQVLKFLGIERKSQSSLNKSKKSGAARNSSTFAQNGIAFVEINGMKLRKAQDVYVKIYQKIFPDSAIKISPDSACAKLEKFFRSSSRTDKKYPHHIRSVVVFIDELDLICSKRQQIVYNLFDWPFNQSEPNWSHNNSGTTKKRGKTNHEPPALIILTVANTMDLPERLLMGRTQSRLGLDRLTFFPYNHSQLLEIISSRLTTSNIFKKDSIQYIARKVAALTGDARRALEICRRAVEVCRERGIDSVGMEEVEMALEDINNRPTNRILRTLSPYERLFIKVLAADIQDKLACDEARLTQVYQKFTTQCQMDGLISPNFTQLLMLCNQLASYKLIHVERHAVNHRARRVRLNLLPSDVFCALQTAQT